MVAKHGEAAIRDAVATVGFTPAEELQHPFEGHTDLYFRSALPEAYFGRGGFRVAGWIQRTKMSGRCWVLNVDAVVFNPGIEVVRDRTDDQDRHRPDVYTSAAARCRRIGEVFGVELSVPSWERLQATRN